MSESDLRGCKNSCSFLHSIAMCERSCIAASTSWRVSGGASFTSISSSGSFVAAMGSLTSSLSERYVVNFAKVRTPQKTPQAVVFWCVVKFTTSCGEIVVVINIKFVHHHHKLWCFLGLVLVALFVAIFIVNSTTQYKQFSTHLWKVRIDIY